MGRGRAKAKQTKVARDLKYRTYETDFSELQRELHGSEGQDVAGAERSSDDDLGDEEEDLLGSNPVGSSIANGVPRN
jgi:hypothetical protein